jgi:signal transduction histidine kinase
MRRLLLGAPAAALVILAIGLFAIDHELQVRIDEALATERLHVGRVRVVREAAEKAYVGMLERWILPLAQRTDQSRIVSQRLDDLRTATTAFVELEPLSATESEARTKLLVGLALFSNRVQKALINEDGPAAIAEISEFTTSIDNATHQVLSIDAAAGHRADTIVLELRKKGSLAIAGLVLTGACAIGLSALWWQQKRRADRRYEAAESARREQVQAAQVRARFYAHLSHELRTPIVVIQNLTDKLKDPAVVATSKRIRQAADELLHGINNVLDSSKLESGSHDLKLEAVDLAQVIRRSAHRCEGLIGVKDVKLVLDTSEDLPAIVADVVKLHQVVTNLIANAIKFTESGTVSVRATKIDTRLVAIEVRDTGMGIPEAALARIWQPFEQADDSISSKFGGTGLGLSLVKALVTLHGGEVGVNSKPGEGTCFRIMLPIAQSLAVA